MSRKVNKEYKHYSLFRVIEIGSEIEKLEQKAKRYTYRGKPTKKRQKLQKLYSQSMSNFRNYKGY
jgi:hypothetical protein